MAAHAAAAPVLRDRIIRAVATAHTARTERDRRAGFASAHAYAAALDIVLGSADQAPAPGIDSGGLPLPPGALIHTRAFLGADNAARLLGDL